jgi:hypothetical protein
VSDYPGRPFTRTRNRLQTTLAELLDDGTGQMRPELQPLADSLLAMPKPDRALNWLRNNPRLPTYLSSLARGHVELSHQGLHQLGSWRTIAHLRDLLMACGTLPALDRQIALFERWTQERLNATADAEHGRLLRQFVSWHQLPQLHAAARRAPLSAGARNYAAEAFLEAEHLLGWLDRHALSLATLSQGELDRWDVERADRSANVFLRRAQRIGHSPRLQQAATAGRPRQSPLSPRRRLTWTGRILTDDTIELRTRAAARLLLMFAQPVTRIVKLTVDDVLTPGQDDGARETRHLPAAGASAHPGPATARGAARRAGKGRSEHEHRQQPGQPLAVPRRPRRPPTDPGCAPSTLPSPRTADHARPHLSDAPPRAASTRTRSRRRARLRQRDRRAPPSGRRRELEPLHHTVSLTKQGEARKKHSRRRQCTSTASAVDGHVIIPNRAADLQERVIAA